jgi:hypothetical protein
VTHLKQKVSTKRPSILLRSRTVALIVVLLVVAASVVALLLWIWSGNQTYTYPGLEGLEITDMKFIGSSSSGSNFITLTLFNTGKTLTWLDLNITVAEAWLNNKLWTTNPATPQTIIPHSSLKLNLTTTSWKEGYNYQVKLMSTKGNLFFYSAYARAQVTLTGTVTTTGIGTTPEKITFTSTEDQKTYGAAVSGGGNPGTYSIVLPNHDLYKVTITWKFLGITVWEC